MPNEEDYNPNSNRVFLIVSESSFYFGTHLIPHPKKIDKGGEDAFFVSNYNGGVLAIADGVSGWAERNVDPALFSQELIMNASHLVEDEEVNYDPQILLRKAHAATSSIGSAAIIVAMLEKSGILKVASVGDCGLRVVREGQEIFSMPPQEHYFDCPYQLSSEIITQTYRDAMVCNLELLEGDTIVMGSDGLFDNVYDHEIVSTISRYKDVAEAGRVDEEDHHDILGYMDKRLRRSPRLVERQQLVDVKKTTMICLDTSNKRLRRSPRLLERQQLSQLAKQQSIDSSTSATDPSTEEDNLHLGSKNLPYSNRLLRIEVVKELLHNDKSSVLPPEKPSKKRKRAGASVRVKYRHVNPLTLSRKSNFFHKLFSNGMRESDPQSTILLKIDSSEEESFFQLLNHMYGKRKSLSKKVVTRTSLFSLLFQADKFETGQDIRPLIDKAEKFLAHKFAHMSKNVDKLKNIDMVVLESMLSRDDLKAGSEDEVFDMVLELVRSRFQKRNYEWL
ncbi:putative protein phosphatase 2C 1 [Acorus calamus]|uniref:Protein phosphatase n=1 Tax=Acorus calamus TaxID=4465 RepID=A0AAV9EFD5_ACOCL|nr:putative protein phosphatase 2C 1 [Acorus calamus]